MTTVSTALPPATASFFVVSGTLPLDSQSYVPRQADKELLTVLLSGEYCFMLNSRQMGKSSLSVRTMAKLQETGVRTVFLDLQKFGGGNVTPEQWYVGLLSETGRALGLRKEFLTYWKENAEYSPVQRFFGVLHDVALASTEVRIVLFIDEIDAVKSLSFSTDEFFAAIRECYNRRVQEPQIGRLAFALVGSATASDLIQDTRTSPFNIGRRIELRDFAEPEVLLLAEGIARPGAQTLAKRAFYWTNGHPFLTQALCAEIAADAKILTPSDVDRLVAQMFFEAKARERNVNLADVSNRMLSSSRDPEHKIEHRAAILDLYKQVWNKRKRVLDDETNRLFALLKLSGITTSRGGELRVRNRIYERVFDRAWIEHNLPDAELRRQKAAFRRGLLLAGSVAGVIVTLLTGLTVWALRNAQVANEKTGEAAVNLRVANQKTQDAHNSAFAERRSALVAQRRAQEKAAALLQAQKAEHRALAAKNEADRQAKKALYAAYVANSARAAEKTATTAAQHSADLARRHADEADRNLYVANMNLLQREWDSNNFGHARELLDVTEARGHGTFEWGYWNRLCHLELLTFKRHKSPVYSAVFFPDAKRIVSGGEDNTARVWDAATGQERLILKGHTQYVSSVAFSTDAKWIVTGSWDKTAKVWDAETGQERLTFKGHNGAVYSVAFSPDATRIATGSYDSKAKVWDVASGRELLTCKGHTGWVNSVAFSADGRRIVTSSWDAARVWDAVTPQELLTLKGHTDGVTSVAFSADGRRIVTSSWDKTAKVWDAETGQKLFTLEGHLSFVRSAAFSPDGTLIVTGSWDKTARVWDAVNGRELRILNGNAARIIAVAFSGDGRRIVTGSSDNTAKVWDVASGREILVLKGHTNTIYSVAYSPDGRRIVTGSEDNTAIVWDAVTGKELRILKGHTEDMRAAVFSPDSRRIVTGSLDNTARIWSAATGQELLTLKGHKSFVLSAAFSADGRRIVTGSEDGTAMVWFADGTHLPSAP